MRNILYFSIISILSIAVLLLWFPLKQKPGIGTILNAIFISIVIDLSLFILPYPKELLFAKSELTKPGWRQFTVTPLS